MSIDHITVNSVKAKYQDFVIIELVNGKKLVNDPRVNFKCTVEDVAGAIMYGTYRLTLPNKKKVTLTKSDVSNVRVANSLQEIIDFGYKKDDIYGLKYSRSLFRIDIVTITALAVLGIITLGIIFDVFNHV